MSTSDLPYISLHGTKGWLVRVPNMYFYDDNYRTIKHKQKLFTFLKHGGRDKALVKAKEFRDLHCIKGLKYNDRGAGAGNGRQVADEDLKGLYIEKYSRGNPEEKHKAGKLYYIHFESDSDSFYKVGITQTSIAARFAMVPKEKVAIEILGLSSVSIYEAWLAEDRIQKNHGSKYRYVRNIKGFSNRETRIGPTECFSQPLSGDLMTLFFQNNT